MSTTNSVTQTQQENGSNILKSFFLILFGLLLVGIFYYKWQNRDKKYPPTESVGPKIKAIELSEEFEKSYFLKKGEVIRVKAPLYYDFECSGGGKKYCIQAQNCKKDTVGGGIPYIKQSENAAYFDLSLFEEEIEVVCSFKRNQK